jgi:thioredoxin
VNKILKIAAPLAIIALIFVIWSLKNKDKDEALVNITGDLLAAGNEFDLEELKSCNLPIMIDFGADECVPCKKMAPILKELHKTYKGKVVIRFVDVWKNPGLAGDFPLEVIPTQFFFDKEGNPFVPENPEFLSMQMYSLKESGDHTYTSHKGGLTREQIILIFKELGVEM